MSLRVKDEIRIKEIVENIGAQFRYGCYNQKRPEACHLLAEFFETIKEDLHKAGIIYKSNCDDYKYGRSCFSYAHHKLLGRNGDSDGAFHYFCKGCDLGVGESCLSAGLMCIGDGKHATRTKDYKKGLQLLGKGCDSNQHFCCYFMGAVYMSGLPDANIERDIAVARKYSEKGCALGSAMACQALSQMYLTGDGVPRDEQKAHDYRARAQQLHNSSPFL
ncbi:Cytochrome c oxidase assembly factor 7 [Blattella germanica]|nr:Cytochrome c oxidase assembly factor 7 [Blattella germanica]